MNSARTTLDLGENAGRAVHGTVAPLVGEHAHHVEPDRDYCPRCKANGGRMGGQPRKGGSQP